MEQTDGVVRIALNGEACRREAVFSSRESTRPAVVLENLDALKEFAGREVDVTEWFSITQERIGRFAEATEDRQWIHVDAERASKESPYGTTIAHGFLTLSLVSHFLKEAIQIRSGVRMAVNYGLNRVRFPFPVRAGSKIRARIGLLDLKQQPDALEATLSVAMEIENSDKPCCVAEWVVRYYQ
jgi:acyl dehydratase